MSKFTQEELVAYVYNETSSILSAAITNASERDEQIREELNNLKQVTNQLVAMSFQPSQVTIERIMLYARLNCCPS